MEDGDLVSSKSEMSFSAWPNPAADQLYITLSNTAEGAVKVQLMDMFGRQVMVTDMGGSKEEQTIKFNLKELSSGMYIVRVLNGENRMEQKVMLIK
ncbi:MAG: T9SS type A sorting domain-containing protein [Chitinophagales bacterium]